MALLILCKIAAEDAPAVFVRGLIRCVGGVGGALAVEGDATDEAAAVDAMEAVEAEAVRTICADALDGADLE